MLNVIECGDNMYLLRYFVAAAVSCRKKKQIIKELGRLFQSEEKLPSDPCIAFVDAVLNHFDFGRTPRILLDCQEVLLHLLSLLRMIWLSLGYEKRLFFGKLLP
jgi:hypothetical protein